MSNLDLFWYCLLEVLIRGSILPQKHYSLWTISKPPQNKLKLHIQSIGDEIASNVKFGRILIFCSWGFNSRSILPQKNYSLWTIRKIPSNKLKLHIMCIGDEIAPYLKFGLILISDSRGFNWEFNSAANWSYKGFGYLDIKEWPMNWFFVVFLVL